MNTVSVSSVSVSSVSVSDAVNAMLVHNKIEASLQIISTLVANDYVELIRISNESTNKKQSAIIADWIKNNIQRWSGKYASPSHTLECVQGVWCYTPRSEEFLADVKIKKELAEISAKLDSSVYAAIQKLSKDSQEVLMLCNTALKVSTSYAQYLSVCKALSLQSDNALILDSSKINSAYLNALLSDILAATKAAKSDKKEIIDAVKRVDKIDPAFEPVRSWLIKKQDLAGLALLESKADYKPAKPVKSLKDLTSLEDARPPAIWLRAGKVLTLPALVDSTLTNALQGIYDLVDSNVRLYSVLSTECKALKDKEVTLDDIQVIQRALLAASNAPSSNNVTSSNARAGKDALSIIDKAGLLQQVKDLETQNVGYDALCLALIQRLNESLNVEKMKKMG